MNLLFFFFISKKKKKEIDENCIATPKIDIYSARTTLLFHLTNTEEANQLYNDFKQNPSSIDYIMRTFVSKSNNNELNEEIYKFRDLIEQMLQLNPNRRFCASQLLKHPLFCENQHNLQLKNPTIPPTTITTVVAALPIKQHNQQYFYDHRQESSTDNIR